MKNLLCKLLGFVFLASLVSGCAFTTDQIELNYNTRGARDVVPGAEGVKVQTTLTDNRQIRDKVGRKINGYGTEMGGIASTTDVAELVRGAIETELTRRGFAKGDTVVVSCELNEFFNHFKQGFWTGDSIASINLAIHVKDHAGNVVFTKNVVEQGVEPNIQLAGGHNAKASLEQALSKAIQSLFDDPAFLPAVINAGSAKTAQPQDTTQPQD